MLPDPLFSPGFFNTDAAPVAAWKKPGLKMTQVEAHMAAYVVSYHHGPWQSNLMENGTHRWNGEVIPQNLFRIMESTPALEGLDTLVLTVLLSQAYDFSIIDATWTSWLPLWWKTWDEITFCIGRLLSSHRKKWQGKGGIGKSLDIV